MTPDFLLKARSNPDLQDFCDYLIKPLQILEELQYRYKNLPLETKVKSNNMNTHLKIDKILNQYLPNMVDNYCDFSFKYRNENFVKTVKSKGGDISYTAKEVLLQNLSKLIEEIHILEEEFNENNKFKLLVQEKILTNLGYYPDLALEEEPSKIVLENKFKYKDQQIFKKSIKDSDKLVENNKKERKKSSFLNSLINSKIFEFSLVIGFILVSFAGIFNMYIKTTTIQQVNKEIRHLEFLNIGTLNLFAGKGDYKILSNKVLLQANVVPDDMIDYGYIRNSYGQTFQSQANNFNISNIYGGTVNVTPSPDFKNFNIAYSAVPNSACSLLVKEAVMFNKIMIGSYTIKDTSQSILLDEKKVDDVCNLTSTKSADIVFSN